MTTCSCGPTPSSKAGGTDPDKIVTAMEQTDYVGTIGRITFLPKDNTFAHGMRIGDGLHHRPDGAVAEGQSGHGVADQRGHRQDGVPGVHQAAAVASRMGGDRVAHFPQPAAPDGVSCSLYKS